MNITPYGIHTFALAVAALSIVCWILRCLFALTGRPQLLAGMPTLRVALFVELCSLVAMLALVWETTP